MRRLRTDVNVVNIKEGGGEPMPMWVLKKEMTVEVRMRIRRARMVWTIRRARIRSKEKEGVGDIVAVAILRICEVACLIVGLCF